MFGEDPTICERHVQAHDALQLLLLEPTQLSGGSIDLFCFVNFAEMFQQLLKCFSNGT